MTRVRLKDIKKTSVKLADGSTATYFYYRPTHTRLPGTPGTAAFMAAYNDAVAKMKHVPATQFRSIISQYKASSDFTGKAASTRANYAIYIRKIEDEFGTLPVAALGDERVRTEFKAWRDKMSETPRAADYAWGTLKRILSWAKDSGLIKENHAARGGRLYKGGERQEVVWTDEDLAKFREHASPEVWAVVSLGFWTGQRQGDCLQLAWTAYDSNLLRVRQSKTDARVVIPVRGAFKVFLDGLPRVSTQILVSSLGRPWSSDGFKSSFARAREDAGLRRLNFHDLRGTRVTRLALAGCTNAQIAAITGHSLDDVGKMLDRHYLGARAELAEQAIDLLEAKLAVAARARALPAPGAE